VDYNKQLSLFDNTELKLSTAENEISILALAAIPGVGFATVRALFNAFDANLSQVWNADDNTLKEYLHQAKIPQPVNLAQQIKEQSKKALAVAREDFYSLKRRRVSIILRGTASYPQSLYDLKSSPAWLFVEGDIDLLNDPAIVAVVGTREPTKNGLLAAKRLSTILAKGGCVILSGLAEGIDEVGHRTAVDYGTPTIGVLGHGIDVVYPASTTILRRQIIERGGTIVSEYLPKDNYNRERFVQRNRIQAALAKIVAVVEGRAKSGTAHTVRFANELGRALFGVSIGAARAVEQEELGNELIRQGDPVFILDDRSGREQLLEYLASKLPLKDREHRLDGPRLFRGLLKEIERLSHDYDVKEADYNWLLDQISQYREKSKLRRVAEDDNSSHHT
jgi:DNA protecting protein DprA